MNKTKRCLIANFATVPKAFPRAIVSENTLHCGLTKFQMHMFLGDKLYEMPLYNNSSAVLRKIELMAKAA